MLKTMDTDTTKLIDTKEIIKNLLSKLSKKERDIISRRFGLKKKKKETLETVGQLHGLTRERIRQIENATIKKINKLDNLEENLKTLSSEVEQLLKEHGGIMEKEYLFHILNTFSPVEKSSEHYHVEKNHYDFLLSKLLNEFFEELKVSAKFKKAYKLKHEKLAHLEEIAEELTSKIVELKRTINTEDIIDLALSSDSYLKHSDKFSKDSKFDITSYWKDEIFDEDSEKVHNNKAIYSVLQAVSDLEQNKFGYWGVHNWGEVKPKTINDKIYLILKYVAKPMHFVKIAEKINEVGFDKKVANPATVHNELILDERYILVGRGIYGLKEWGYKEGIVADVIREILEENGPMLKENIIEKVLENRLVKKTTINLALMNKDRFEKIDNKYQIKK